ncbi:phosphoenolpyruvate carboxykinase (ATP) [Chloroflexota bacterium]|nr:phosphoenolpyruvate carboxykinase (ATP) [Chloroflexota bacterium]
MDQALTHWLDAKSIHPNETVLYNPDRETLVREALLNHEGELTPEGALNVITAPYTGRSPKDKYLLNDGKQGDIWWGPINQPVDASQFEELQQTITEYLSRRKLYVVDCRIGADPQFQKKIRLVTEYAWQALLAENLFINAGLPHQTTPEITILAASSFQLPPEFQDSQSPAAVYLDLNKEVILIAGTKYGGEIKKSAFTVMNGILPKADVLPMHCSANVGPEGDVALYFGLSGTGKTTLSATPDRMLIGDDEHGWGKNGIFNFEGGCYAKTIRLNPELEPMIWKATNDTATVLENVVLDPKTHQPDFDDGTITENTRSAYPLTKIENSLLTGISGHPSNIFFLTADAFGVLPPIALLNEEEIAYYFLSGYTSKLAGTERGLGKQPKATFSTCFAEPFLPLKPSLYAQMLQEKVRQHACRVWLINTGWTGGDFHSGYRMPLPHTRSMVSWALSNPEVSFHQDSVFGLSVPDEIPGVPSELLYPERTWADKEKFSEVSHQLKRKFEENFKRFDGESLVMEAGVTAY